MDHYAFFYNLIFVNNVLMVILLISYNNVKVILNVAIQLTLNRNTNIPTLISFVFETGLATLEFSIVKALDDSFSLLRWQNPKNDESKN
ncbi:hypothetical protein RO3G_09366 [Rhizopus delemar RA 99-880]|uniref:Uncharacterized protein n=1 Tax=Rhizopus delemar (strain RA 99-880 / ATCC MYA-4621 / FGSC 9543 / NRRL 43880) TaxID=246409 RepID=I1C876_RHIO9|nr:hypothetical protein RO3G_09366 [Rhizopus delemar RA 99-880]|eukprot:EIE84656.1 hypothetical protein RO3G_09366 [Rhizopus delemar RA 99-880]